MIEHKRWGRLVRAGEWFHLARVHFMPGRSVKLHTHDFPEVFWVEEGRGLHQINGADKKLAAGDLIFVRAEDRHVLRAADESGFTLVNLAFPAAVLEDLATRHASVARLHAGRAALPERRTLSPAQVRILREDVRRLASGARERMPLERFLLGLYLAASPTTRAPGPALPEWLERACAQMERPEHFAQGTARMAQLCGRSPEYMARSCRKLLGVSPTEWVNRVRMEHAARELRLGAKPILEICLECGFSNVAHFYALFRQAYGETPRRYRVMSQESVG
jgi:AraC family cel operon transcriptional repressor